MRLEQRARVVAYQALMVEYEPEINGLPVKPELIYQREDGILCPPYQVIIPKKEKPAVIN